MSNKKIVSSICPYKHFKPSDSSLENGTLFVAFRKVYSKQDADKIIQQKKIEENLNLCKNRCPVCKQYHLYYFNKTIKKEKCFVNILYRFIVMPLDFIDMHLKEIVLAGFIIPAVIKMIFIVLE